MAEWFADGRAIDLILAAVALECAFLVWLGRRRGVAPFAWLPALAAGASLLLALRLTLAAAAWQWIAALLAVSLLAHLVDLARRLEPGR